LVARADLAENDRLEDSLLLDGGGEFGNVEVAANLLGRRVYGVKRDGLKAEGRMVEDFPDLKPALGRDAPLAPQPELDVALAHVQAAGEFLARDAPGVEERVEV
jgi:hypothetical protein